MLQEHGSRTLQGTNQRNGGMESGYRMKDVEEKLRNDFGLTRGCSTANLYLFCSTNDIHRSDYGRRSQDELRDIVEAAAYEGGPTFGRKMVAGYLKASGMNIGERVVRRFLPQANPQFANERRQGIERQTNPHPYYAEYAGHKLHLDQNEKLVDYGVTVVCAIDGFSKFITGYSVMSIKNNVIIYDEVYRPSVLTHGLPDQIRVDFGKEFYLILFQQENLMHLRNNLERPPYVQTPSTQNHVIERMWVEFNTRVLYPLKCALVDMKNNEEIDMADPLTKFCVSTITSSCCRVGMETVVQSWNYHIVPKKGIPVTTYQAHCQAKRIDEKHLPQGITLVEQYNEAGGHIAVPGSFGEDSLKDYPHLQSQREAMLTESFPSPQMLMTCARNRNTLPFHDAVMYYINVTRTLSNNLI